MDTSKRLIAAALWGFASCAPQAAGSTPQASVHAGAAAVSGGASPTLPASSAGTSAVATHPTTMNTGVAPVAGSPSAANTLPPPNSPPAVTPPPPPPAANGGAAAPAAMMAASSPLPTMDVPTSKNPKLPDIKGDCPDFKEGTNTSDFMGFKGAIWEVGAKTEGKGSLIFYWHGTGSSNSEYKQSMPAMLIADVKAKGGIIVSPQSGTGSGGDCSGTATFSMDDFTVADQIAACAVKNWGIDPHRIYSTGCSAGGLQAGCMAMVRSSYMAAAVPNSGGETFAQAPQDASHIAAIMTMHGARGQDVVIVDFNDTSQTIDDSVKTLGGFAVDCDHGGGHCAIPMPPVDLYMAGWQFMQDHPFGYTKEPYGTMLPTTFPKYCKIW